MINYACNQVSDTGVSSFPERSNLIECVNESPRAGNPMRRRLANEQSSAGLPAREPVERTTAAVCICLYITYFKTSLLHTASLYEKAPWFLKRTNESCGFSLSFGHAWQEEIRSRNIWDIFSNIRLWYAEEVNSTINMYIIIFKGSLAHEVNTESEQFVNSCLTYNFVPLELFMRFDPYLKHAEINFIYLFT